MFAHILWAFINFPDTFGGMNFGSRLVIYGEVYTMFVVTNDYIDGPADGLWW